MRTKLIICSLSLLALPALTAGCSNTTREALGLTKRSPDEFQVVSNAPLSMPPDYNLRPPTPGAARPQEGTVREQAERVVRFPATRQGLPHDQRGFGLSPVRRLAAARHCRQ